MNHIVEVMGEERTNFMSYHDIAKVFKPHPKHLDRFSFKIVLKNGDEVSSERFSKEVIDVKIAEFVQKWNTYIDWFLREYPYQANMKTFVEDGNPV